MIQMAGNSISGIRFCQIIFGSKIMKINRCDMSPLLAIDFFQRGSFNLFEQ